MKTLAMTIALVILTSLSFAQTDSDNSGKNLVMDTENMKCVMFSNSNDMVTLILDKKPGEKVSLRIKDGNDEVLFQKRISKVDKTKLKLDISAFISGDYTFELVQKKEVLYTKTFTKRDQAIVMAY
jgi:hypothetical protein